LTAGQVAFDRRMDFLALAAVFAQPPDYLVARDLAVGDDAEQLVGTLAGKRLRLER